MNVRGILLAGGALARIKEDKEEASLDDKTNLSTPSSWGFGRNFTPYAC